MHADIEGAIRITRLAADFDWTWYTDDITRLCDTMGWEVAQSYELSTRLRTKLRIQRPEATVHLRKRTIEYISCRVTDINDDSVPFEESRRRVINSFTNFEAALNETLGPPERRVPGADPEIRWYLPKVVICLSAVTRSIGVDLCAPEYQMQMDGRLTYDE